MVDPVHQAQAKMIAQQAQRGGLQQLLQSGRPVEGQVMQARPGGKVDVQIMGRTFTLDAQGLGLKSGQAVLARLIDGNVMLQPGSQASSGSSPNLSSLGPLLQQAGLQSPQASVIAQAMLSAGIPFDKAVIKELATILPKVMPGELGALTFLMSRGMPITPNMATWVSRLLANRARIGSSLERLQESLREVTSDAVDGEELADEVKERLRDLGDMNDFLRQKTRQSTPEEPMTDEEIEELIRGMLASPEALLSKHSGQPKALGDTLLRILATLLELREQIQTPSLLAKIDEAIEQAKTLHEQFGAQALRNVPAETGSSSPVYVVQVPVTIDGQTREFELRYTPRQDKDNAGSLDLRLELSHTGPMLVSLQWEKPRLHLSFQVESKKIREVLEAGIEPLMEMLRAKGFSLDAPTFTVKAVEETLTRPETLTTEKSVSGGINIRV